MQTITLERPFVRDALLVILSSLCIGLFGKISIPLWFTPVPLVLQNGLILLNASILGAKRGTAATALFLAQGAIGLPVFAGGAGGLACFAGPTAGYLIGYLVASFVTGWIVQKTQMTLAALIAGNAIILALGAGYLATFVGAQKAFALGVAPFLIGDCLKIIVSFAVIRRIQWA